IYFLHPVPTSPFFYSLPLSTSSLYPLSLHDALPIYVTVDVAMEELDRVLDRDHVRVPVLVEMLDHRGECRALPRARDSRHEHERSEEHTSELQSHLNLVCRLLLEKKKNII